MTSNIIKFQLGLQLYAIVQNFTSSQRHVFILYLSLIGIIIK